MKKKFLPIIVCTCIFVLAIFCLSACNKKNKINFIVDGNVYHTIETAGNEEVFLPQNPSKAGYKFEGWFYDGLIEQFAVDCLKNKPLEEDVNIYAKFDPFKINLY